MKSVKHAKMGKMRAFFNLLFNCISVNYLQEYCVHGESWLQA